MESTARTASVTGFSDGSVGNAVGLGGVPALTPSAIWSRAVLS